MNAKENFQKSPFAKGYTDLVDSPQMQAALNAAMLHYQGAFQMPSDMATAAANEFRRQGAVQYRLHLESLNSNQKPPPPPAIPKLDHQH